MSYTVEIVRLREALDAAIHLINGLRADCPDHLLSDAEQAFEEKLAALRTVSDVGTPPEGLK